MSARGSAPKRRMLGRILVEPAKREVSRGISDPEGILDPESWREIADLLREAALRYLDVHALWVADGLEHRAERDFHHGLWRAARMPGLLEDNALQGGPSSCELRT